MLLIKNDPKYNEQWPRALVPYKRIYGVDEPARLPPRLPMTASVARHLPEGTPFGLVGTSSLYKRESYPHRRACRKARSRRTVAPRWQRLRSYGRSARSAYTGIAGNWGGQGADAGLYDNSDIHAIRILVMEPTTGSAVHRHAPSRRWWNNADERLRILGEFPVRKFQERRAAGRSGRQSRHQLPGQDPGRRGLDVPDARQGRHGAEHGPDLAPAAARRGPQRLRRLPRPQPEADAASRTPPRRSPTTRSST